jgi:hypothetical protein
MKHVLANLISLVALLLVGACAPSRNPQTQDLKFAQDEKVHSADMAENLDTKTWPHLHRLFDFYSVDGRLSVDQLDLLFAKFSPSFAEHASKSIRRAPVTRFTFEQMEGQLESDCLTLTWIKQGSLEHLADRLVTLNAVFPNGTPATIQKFSDLIDARFHKQELSSHDTIELGVLLSFYQKAETSPIYAAKIKTLLPASLDQASSDDRKLNHFIASLSLNPEKKP